MIKFGGRCVPLQLPGFVQAMLDPTIYPDPVDKVELVQTQMSFVFLAGRHVYKVKKPVNLGYLDFSTLEKRHFFCNQELVLNRRLCPGAYLALVPITRNNSEFALDGQGEVIDYAVKMVHLPHDRMLDYLLENNRVSVEMIDSLARKMVDFHIAAATSPTISAFGKFEIISFNVNENFNQTEKYFSATITANRFKRIQTYTLETLRQKAGLFAERVAGGKIRDCHGDLHCQHICFLDGICIIDCIDFNDRFRYIDVAADIAFLAMDLDHFGRADLSRRFISTYIELSQDGQIREFLKFYKCYRAYVRGKVGSFEFDDPYISVEEREKTRETALTYFELSESYARERPRLLITVGLVGSGKSTVSRALARRLGLTVLSSDVIRKQLAGVPLTEHHFDEMESGIYTSEFSRGTYELLLSGAKEILAQGDSVILDASFIRTDERLKAQKLAQELAADYFVLECTLDEVNTRQRLARRLETGAVSDGRWEIYRRQKQKFEPVDEVAASRHFVIDTTLPLYDQLTRIIDDIL
jgi:aminoglycoside phosphotransferase family enzyme/predicted kinase